MDPLLQFDSHAFVPYTNPSSQANLPPLSLNTISTWTYCGPILSPSVDALPQSFHAWSHSTVNGPLLPRLLPLLAFLQKFLHDAGAEHYWITLRASKPTSEYNTVRWHTDDIFFDADGEENRTSSRSPTNYKTHIEPPALLSPSDHLKTRYWKLAATLLGPPTLFLADAATARAHQRRAKATLAASNTHTCVSMRCPTCLEAIDRIRNILASTLSGAPVESPAAHEVAFFRLGDEAGAVHSEPRCDVDRIFVNVVPGSKDELSALMARWGLRFPRAWTFGVPVEFEAEFEGVGGRVDSPVPEGGGGGATLPGVGVMSVSLGEEYSDWLARKGFRFTSVFGGREMASDADMC